MLHCELLRPHEDPPRHRDSEPERSMGIPVTLILESCSSRGKTCEYKIA